MPSPGDIILTAMSVLELKQQISNLGKRQREEVFAYMVRLKHETPEWKRMAAQRIRKMKKGAGVTQGSIENLL